MFTLCMSRGPPHLQDACRNSLPHKQVKGGYLLRYRKGFFCRGWREEWVVLYEDSTLAWYADKGLSRARGFVRISDAPHLLAVGEFTRQVPRMPRFPRSCAIGQLLAVGCRTMHDVYWLMGQSSAEINDWMTAISNTLPPPPTVSLDGKRLSITHQQHDGLSNGCVPSIANGCVHNGIPGRTLPSLPSIKNGTVNGTICTTRNGNTGALCMENHLKHPKSPTSSFYSNKSSLSNKPMNTKKKNYNNDHVVMEGVIFNWGQGWGWTQVTNSAPEVVSASVYCHAAEDCGGYGGFDDMDLSAFGDFCF